MTSPIERYWQRYVESLQPDVPHPTDYQAWHFADTQAGADELVELVVGGIKTATASLAWGYEFEKEPLPRPGDLSVITDWAGNPRCVIEAACVEIVPFDQVSAEFAFREGEGSRTLGEWREVHWKFFTRECAVIGFKPSMDMPVVCEHFRLIYKEEQ